MRRLDQKALAEVMKHVDEACEGDAPEDVQQARVGITNLLQIYFDSLDLTDEQRAIDKLVDYRTTLGIIITTCVESQQTLRLCARPDQAELCNMFLQILKRIAHTADAHFGSVQ